MNFRKDDSANMIVADALAEAGKGLVTIEMVLNMLRLPDSERSCAALREVATLIAVKVKELNPVGWAKATQETEDQIRREKGDKAADDFKRRREASDAKQMVAEVTAELLPSVPKPDSN